jgi:exopolysaccharide biosynthesis polyprenyl glycosylphosphotransferase
MRAISLVCSAITSKPEHQVHEDIPMADPSRSEILRLVEGPWASFQSPRPSRPKDVLSATIDAVSVLGATAIASAVVLRGTYADFWGAIASNPQQAGTVAILVFGFTASVLVNCNRFNLYTPERSISLLREQKHILQAILTSSLLLGAMVYLLDPNDPRTLIVPATIVLAVAMMSGRRIAERVFLRHSLAKGAGTRNVLIVGTGPTARALRAHLESIGHLGYVFKGFIAPLDELPINQASSEVVGTFDRLFDHIHSHFVDEIFFAANCAREDIQRVISEAGKNHVNIRLVPHPYESSTLPSQFEYIGQIPTIPVLRRTMPESQLFLKRIMDIGISAAVLVALAPVLLIIALLVKRDSRGPVLYSSERVGKKGKIFHCLKFRTMVKDSDRMRSALESRNQRDEILFKIADDPRITRVGRFLRKYSLDELPQLLNVLWGQMSIVGPRPPLAGEVMRYKPNQLRRLDVTPGLTGLWQVQARNDPSFASYVSMDLEYIENWSILLDLEIMARTIGVVLAGTGS